MSSLTRLSAVLTSQPALVSRTVMVSAWLVPFLVVVQFAMMAVVPVALVLVGGFWDARLRAFRGWAAALAVVYAVVLAHRAFGPDPSLSLSKSMGPVFTTILIAVSAAVAVAFHVLTRRRATDARYNTA